MISAGFRQIFPVEKTGNPHSKHTDEVPPLRADPFALGHILADVYRRTQPLLTEFLEKYEFDMEELAKDPLNLRPAYAEFLTHLWSNPQKLLEIQMQFWNDWLYLCQESANRFLSGKGHDIYQPDKGDRRFKNEIWNQSAVFDFIKQSYLLTSKYMQDLVEQTEGLDDETKVKVEFYTRQFANAIAPTNFLLTNPEVLQETIDTGGDNLVRGFQNLIEDLKRGRGELKISTTNYKAFRLGENIAVTPGKVIFQNDVMQLIQYEPETKTVFRKPLLIIPPWINKYYILDLKPANSFVKWVVEQGHTVFIVSWVNPDAELAKKRFEDYMEEGVLEAMAQVRTVTGEPDCNIVGYCLGGTLTAVTLAYLAAHRKAKQIISATFLTAMVDFEKSGEMKLFMDSSQLQMMDKEMEQKGFLPADHLQKTFSLLRSNDLIWSFVINNYLMGREPFPFDLLYWNDDSTNMPAAVHSFYMRKCYNENMLPVPGGVTMKGTPIDMRKIKTPCYLLSTKEDHIAPWKATYANTQMFSGPVHFTLAASGHVAGVINPPAADKYCFWTAEDNPPTPEEWLERAKQTEGSWWPHWAEWVKQFAGDHVPARKPGGGKLKPLEDAPGSYVKAKSDEVDAEK